MSFPSPADFKDWLSLGNAPLLIDNDVFLRWHRATRESGGTITPTLVAEYCAHLLRAIESANHGMNATPLWEWLARQAPYLQAERMVIEGRKNRKVVPRASGLPIKIEEAQDLIDKTVAIYIDALARQKATVEHFRPDLKTVDTLTTEAHRLSEARELARVAIDRLIERQACLESKGRNWTFHLVFALDEYYNANAAHQILAIGKSIGLAVPQAQAAIEELLRSFEVASVLGFAKRNSIETLLNFQRRMQVLTKGLKLPLDRRDEHGGEHLFIYRMVGANQEHSKSSKVEAIGELMRLDGFRYRFDARQLQRLCTKFAGRLIAPEAQNLSGYGSGPVIVPLRRGLNLRPGGPKAT